MVTAYLEPYGYLAAEADPEEWMAPPNVCARQPKLEVKVEGHTEVSKHTVYNIRCRLTAEGPELRLEWDIQRRLIQLREGLHDTVKNELGNDYNDLFADAPFAKRGGFGGTTERLQKWLEALAACANAGHASPALVAQVLLFLDTPPQFGHQEAAEQHVGDNMFPTEGPETLEGLGTDRADDEGAESPQSAGGEHGFRSPQAKSPAAAPASGPPSPGPPDRQHTFAPGPGPEAHEATSPLDSRGGNTRSPRLPERQHTFAGPGAEEPQEEPARQPAGTATKVELPRSPRKEAPAADTGGTQAPKDAKEVREQEEVRVEAVKSIRDTHWSIPRPWLNYSEAPPLDPEARGQVPKFLESYGYDAVSPEEWGAMPNLCRGGPRFSLNVDGHSELNGHTFYHIRCGINAHCRSLQMEWTVQRQLVQVRTDLHEVAKGLLGKTYGEAFQDAPFARRGAPSGTTGRLKKWLGSLATCVNAGAAPPLLVAQVLFFLRPPLREGAASPAAGASPRGPAEEEAAAAGGAAEPRPAPGRRGRAASPGPRARAAEAARRGGAREGPPPEREGDEAQPPRPTPGGSAARGGTTTGSTAASTEGNSTDDEGAAWSAEKRKAGYLKLQRFFAELRRALERKAKRRNSSRSPTRGGTST